MTAKDIFIGIPKRGKANIADSILLIGLIDLILLFYGDFALRMNFITWKYYLVVPAIFIVIYLFLQWATKLNNILWEYTSGKPFIYLLMNLFISSFVTYGLTVAIFFSDVKTAPIGALYVFVTIFFVSYAILSAFKLIVLQLYVRRHYNKHKKDEPKGNVNNTMIIGAGWTGTNLATAFSNDHTIFKPVCFIDDNPDKLDHIIQDLPVAGTSAEIEKVVKKYDIKKIIFAIPSCDSQVKKSIIKTCIETKCELKVVPPIQEMVNACDGKEIKPRDVKIEDLLGREPTVFDNESIKNQIKGKVVLVTGGGGSIGSELCRQIASFEPKQLIIMDIYENNAYDIQQELIRHYPKLNLETIICSIADYERCDILFEKFKPELIFHAAAHKHVPLMEHVPEQAIKNNIVGTFNLCQLACKHHVQRMLLISTDKAVNPTNVMGASKRCCEMIMKYHSQICPDTVFVAVRFGNVLGSNGSVIPLFKHQIEEGGPVTLTDKKIIRYFMTIPEAVALVLETGTFAKTGQIYVLDMGEPVKILDLAENMITLMGYKPYEDIDIIETGLRPGEKLFEELLISGEGLEKTINKKIFICQQIDVKEDEFIKNLNKLVDVAKANNPDGVIDQLHVLIPTYHTPEEVNSKVRAKQE